MTIAFFGLGIATSFFYYFCSNIGALDAVLQGFGLVSLSPFLIGNSNCEMIGSWILLQCAGVMYSSFLMYSFFYKKISPRSVVLVVLSASLLIQLCSVLALYFVSPISNEDGSCHFMNYLLISTSAFFGSGAVSEVDSFSIFYQKSYLGVLVIASLCWIGMLGFSTLADFFSPERLSQRLRFPEKRIEKGSALFLWTLVFVASLSTLLMLFETSPKDSIFGRVSISALGGAGIMGLWNAPAPTNVLAFFLLILTSALPIFINGRIRKDMRHFVRWFFTLIIGTIALTVLCHWSDPHQTLFHQGQMIFRGWLGAGSLETEALSNESKIMMVFSLILGRLATFAAIMKIRTNSFFAEHS